jgi:hypothetical protein
VPEFAQRHADLRGRGVRVVQRSLEGLAGLVVQLLEDDAEATFGAAGWAIVRTCEAV